MKLRADGFENPHLIEPKLNNIYKQAQGSGFSADELKSLKQKIKQAFEQGVADPDSALNQLELFFAEPSLDLKWLLKGKALFLVLRLFGYCEFLSQLALKNPDWLKTALAQLKDKKRAYPQIAKRLESKLSKAGSFEEFSRSLREFRNQEYLRLALANLGEPDRLEEELLELSFLAEACLELGLKYLFKLGQEGKIPLAQQNFSSLPLLSVLGMGKLGTYELNFSSDIDLIYLCSNPSPSSSETEAQLKAYFRLAELFTRLLSEITAEGFVFRVDLRLRPGGESGPLVNSFESALDYYLNFGRAWERAVFLRARPVSGDRGLAQKFLSELEPFVFKKFHDFTSLEELKEIKFKIKAEAKSRSQANGLSGYDLKLGSGGIREVEFFVQALQLIYGGRYSELKHKSTPQALKILNQLGLVKDADANILDRAWRLLRRLEHRIQLKNLYQDHSLPKNKRTQETLARSFGYIEKNGTERFFSELRQILEQVEEIFSELFGEEPKVREGKFFKFITGEIEEEELEKEFAKLGFNEPDLAVKSWLRIIKPLERVKAGSQAMREALPVLLEEISKTAEPELALLQLERFLSRTGARFGFLALLKDYPPVRKVLIELFSASEFLGNVLVSHPELLDELVIPGILKERSPVELEAELEQELAQARDYEQKLFQLQRFQKLEFLRTGLKELGGGISIWELEQRLSLLAELILEQVYKISLSESIRRFGAPGFKKGEEASGLLILGLGKLGAQEMSWASDLDLIFIYQGEGMTQGKTQLSLHEFFVRLSQKIISLLESQTAEGYLYQIDTRLRPSGRFGPLVVSLSAFSEYQATRAQLWEKQAMIKARALIDGAGIREKVLSQIEKSVYFGNQPDQLKAEMNALLTRVRAELAQERENLYDIKLGYGGEMELEYIIQFFQLSYGERYPELRASSSWNALSALKNLKLIEEKEYLELVEILKFYRLLFSRLRIYQDRGEHQLKIEPNTLGRLAKKLFIPEIDSGEKLLAQIKSAREKVHSIFQKYLGD